MAQRERRDVHQRIPLKWMRNAHRSRLSDRGLRYSRIESQYAAALMFMRRSAEAVQIEEEPADATSEAGATSTAGNGVVI